MSGLRILGVLTFLTLASCSTFKIGDNENPNDDAGASHDHDGGIECLHDNWCDEGEYCDHGTCVDRSDGGSGSDAGTPEDGGSGGGSDGGTGTDAGDDPCDGDPGDGSDGTCGSGKTLLCHEPPGHPSQPHEVCVGSHAVEAHLAHGDTLGLCP